MAIFTVASPFDKVSGTIGGANGVVVYSIDGRNLMRGYVIPTDPKTEYQLAVRQAFGLSSQAYSQTTSAEREAWAALAANITRDDALGQGYVMTAQMAFMMVNQYRQLAGVGITNTAPAYELPVLIGTPAFTLVGETNVQFSTEGNELQTYNGYILVSSTAALAGEARQARDGDYTSATVNVADAFVSQASGETVFGAFNVSAIRNLPSTGNRIGVRYQPLSSGYVPGASIEATVTVAYQP